MRQDTLLDDVASDLAVWVDETANKIALAFAPGRAPFAAKATEEQKLAYYSAKLFNPDGSPNHQGRTEEIQRLGAEAFGQVYKAVIAAHPEWKPAEEPEELAITPPIEQLRPPGVQIPGGM